MERNKNARRPPPPLPTLGMAAFSSSSSIDVHRDVGGGAGWAARWAAPRPSPSSSPAPPKMSSTGWAAAAAAAAAAEAAAKAAAAPPWAALGGTKDSAFRYASRASSRCSCGSLPPLRTWSGSRIHGIEIRIYGIELRVSGC